MLRTIIKDILFDKFRRNYSSIIFNFKFYG